MKSFERALKKLRTEIDKSDRELMRVLSRRMKTVQKIGALKKKYSQPIVQSIRFKQILRSRAKAAQKQGLSSGFVEKLLKLIHTEAILIQKKVRK